MVQIHEYQKLQSYGYGDHYAIVAKSNNKCQYLLRRTLQVVVSISILSLVYCYSHGVSFFPHSFSVYFSTFLFSLFTRTFERKYMFLICNGILAFLAKTSVSGDHISSYSDQTTLVPHTQSSAVSTKAPVVEDHDQVESSTDDVVFEDEGEETTAENEQAVHHQRQRPDLVEDQQVKGDNNDHHNEEILSLMNSATSCDDDENDIDKDDDDDEGNNGSGGREYFLSNQESSNYDEELISTDELNKKIEEFIRRMKEEIRVEAQ